MQKDFNIDKSYDHKCIQANKHNHVSASYYLLFKEKIKKGEKSNADVRQPDYNSKLFTHTAKSIKRENKCKLENTSIQIEDDEAFEIVKTGNSRVKPDSSKERSKS